MSGFRESIRIYQATIANGQTKSAAVDTGVDGIFSIDIPAALTGTAFSFEVSNDNVTYRPLYDDNNTLYSITITVSTARPLDPIVLGGYRYIKIVSNATEGGSRVFNLNGRVVA